MNKEASNKAILALLLLISSAWIPLNAHAQACTTPPAPGSLCFYDQTAPNIIGDVNLNSQTEGGPRSFTIAAKVCNFTGAAVSDVLVTVGDGATPGNFPIATVPVGAPYLDDNYRLNLMSASDATRFEGTLSLADGACLPFYFPVYYRVVDPAGVALWGKSNTPDDDLPMNYSLWGTVKDGGGVTQPIAPLDDTVTIRNEITASSSKVQPNPSGETWYSLQYPTTATTRAAGIPWDPDGANLPPAGATQLVGVPPAVAPGETITVYFRNPTFGNPNQGFDVAPPPGPDTDLWFQPIGERYWNPDAFRLVKVQSFLRGTGCSAAGEPAGERFYYIDDVEGASYMINAGAFEAAPAFLLGMEHMENQTWYASELQNHGCNAWDAEWYGYTFMALKQGESRISPYQEVASGSDNEKYNDDYCGDQFGSSAGDANYSSPHLSCVPLVSAGTPDLELVKTVDKTADAAGGILTYTINTTNIGTVSVGSPTSGVQIVDQIPADTAYVAASATCNLTCAISFSTDGGSSWSSFEPAPATVTHLRWAFNTSLAPAAIANAGFQVQIDNPYGPGSGTVSNTAQLRIDNGPFLLQDNATTSVNIGQVRVHLFFDANNNSVQDAGEPDLSGIDVQITDSGAGLQIVTSDANGNIIADVPAGATDLSVVAATVPAGYVLTTANDTQLGIVSAAGSTASGTDIGYTVPAPAGIIGDFVWEDLDGNGAQDGGEPGIDGVTVELKTSSCSLGIDCPTTVTAGGGLYSFSNLSAGTYFIYIDENSVPGFPAPVRTTTNNPLQIVLGPDEINNTADFGYASPIGGVIGDRVWADQNNDGVQDPGEPGLAGITLELQDGVCTPGVNCPTTATNIGGVYLFNDLSPGNYTVVTLAPLPGPAGAFPPTMPIALAQSQAYLDADFPLVVPNANIGNFIWNDIDGDGIQDGGGEVGLPNVIVELLFAEDTSFSYPPACTPGLNCPDCIASTAPLTLADLPRALPDCPAVATDGSGAYVFDNGGAGLSPHSYRVKIHENTLPAGMSLTTPDSVIVPLSGSDFLSADFGAYTPFATIGDRVWADQNGNGIQDAGETGVSGIFLELRDGLCTPAFDCPTTVTVADGSYSFTVTDPAMYVIHVINDTSALGYTYSPQDVGGDDNLDSDINPLTGNTAGFPVFVPSTNVSIDIGLVPLPVIGLAKQLTSITPAGSGLMDITFTMVVENLGGVALQNVQVTDDLSSTFPAPVTYSIQAGPTAGGTLSANGAYDGSGDINLLNAGASTLTAGATATISFTVRINPNGEGGPFNNTATAFAEDNFSNPTSDISDNGNDPDPDGDGNPNEAGENDPTPVSLAYVTTHVYEDSNGNAVQDVGEPDLAGIEVLITGVSPTPTTDGNGDITAAVAAGNVTCDIVEATLPAGYILTTANEPDNISAVAGAATACGPFGYQPAPLPPVIGIAKQVTGIALVPGGLADISYSLVVENLGPVALQNVQITDDLANTFPAPVSYSIQTGPSAAGTLTANGGFNGAGDINLLNAGASSLAISASATVTLTVRINPNGENGPFNNTAQASAEDSLGTTTSDASDDGVDPDPNGNSNPNEAGENDPTPVSLAYISTHVYEDSNGNAVQDGGEPGLPGINVLITGVNPAPSTDANGDLTALVIASNVTCDVDETSLPAGYSLTTANEPDNVSAVAGTTTVCGPFGYQPPGTPGIGLAKQLDSIIEQGNDVYDLYFTFQLANLGSTTLNQVQVEDNLSTTFPAPISFTILSLNTVGTITANIGYDGMGDIYMLDSQASSLTIGDTASISLGIRLTANGTSGTFYNSALVNASDPNDSMISDISQNGSNPDPNDNNIPDDNGEDTPTPVVLGLLPAISIPSLSLWGLLGLAGVLILAARLRERVRAIR